MLRVVNMSITQLENLIDATLMVLLARAESSSQTLGACEILNVSAALMHIESVLASCFLFTATVFGFKYPQSVACKLNP